ncbi:hypothetical protein DMENIID0001_010240 [Sergentomyia squamirostris]
MKVPYPEARRIYLMKKGAEKSAANTAVASGAYNKVCKTHCPGDGSCSQQTAHVVRDASPEISPETYLTVSMNLI